MGFDGMTLKEIAVKLLSYVPSVLIAVMLLLLITSIEEKKPVMETEVVCVVENKSTHVVMAGKAAIRKYTIDVRVLDADKTMEDTIYISSTMYDIIQIGDEVKCILYYTEDEMQKIELIE